MLPQFHLLAARRGKGLRQEFLELFASREALGAVNVDDISICLAEHFFIQGGAEPGRPDRWCGPAGRCRVPEAGGNAACGLANLAAHRLGERHVHRHEPLQGEKRPGGGL